VLAIIKFYIDGFRSMRVGRTLWKIILIKLVVMFAVLKVFFFPNILETRYDNDQARADHVLNHLTLTDGSHQQRPETHSE